ncbi:FG-GAP repeat domain-containing protein [Pseudoalteromonas sp. 68 DY56-GL68]|uniref:FG-GAP repeat domain-containing protein n=1 Tax=Pseudoalteromonas sp. 68 DY56-GL68 TaxID=2974919 RepID=UPI00352B536B
MKHSFLKLMVIVTPLYLVACGGGGSDSNTSNEDASPPTSDDNNDQVVNTTVPKKVLSSLIVDANGDNNMDIIVSAYSNTGYENPLLMLNDGNGEFTELEGAIALNNSNQQIKASPHMAMINANNDEYSDVILVNTNEDYTESEFHLLLGSDSGQFTDATTNISESIFTGWGEVIVADIDQDGFDDFILAQNPNGAQCEVTQTSKSGCFGGTIYLNDGTGLFSPTSIELFDDSNGAQYSASSLQFTDLASGGIVNSEIKEVWRVEAGDLNGDSIIDLVAPTFGERMIPSFINQSSAGNVSFRITYSDVPLSAGGGSALLDVNRDGFLDLVMSEAIYNGAVVADHDTQTTPVYIAVNDGNGNFTEANDLFEQGVAKVQHARAWIVADFDLDGNDDLFVADHGYDFPPFSGYQNLLLMNSASGLTNTTELALGIENTFTHGASVGDINNDGYPDLYLNNDLQLIETSSESASASPRLWLNNGDGTFTASSQEL